MKTIAYLPLSWLSFQSTLSNSCRSTPRCSSRVAFVRGVPSTLSQGILAPGVSSKSIDVGKAQKQHAEYVRLLRHHIDYVYELPTVESCPDSVFLEDAAIVLGDSAMQGVAGHQSRRDEIELLTPLLEEQGIQVKKMKVQVDGGDILYVEGQFFVGVSARTELSAASALSECFDCNAIPIDVADGTLHMKCVVTWISAARMLIVQDSEVGRSVLQQMREAAREADWEVAWVPETAQHGANVLDLGHTALLQAAAWDEMIDVRSKLKRNGVEPVPCDMSELMKANGALTCCSILTDLERG